VTGAAPRRPAVVRVRVEIEAEGPRPAVDALVGWARRGPPRAVVDTLVVEDLEVGGAAAVRGGGGSGFRVVG
jgi:hypothetical protein